jgi:hypothetical protein
MYAKRRQSEHQKLQDSTTREVFLRSLSELKPTNSSRVKIDFTGFKSLVALVSELYTVIMIPTLIGTNGRMEAAYSIKVLEGGFRWVVIGLNIRLPL